MNIKTLMDLLNNESDGSLNGQKDSEDEKVIYIDNARLETVSEQADRREILASGTQWADQTIGDLLIDEGILDYEQVSQILDYQRKKGLYFGEAAVALKLVNQEDILHALSIQFGYTYNRNEESLSKEVALAYSPFGEQAEEFRSIRSKLLNGWLSPNQKTLAIVSPEGDEGRSYVAANLALAFSQLGRPTLLIDADMRAPRQHEIFNFTRTVGLSKLLARRVRMEDLSLLPEQLSNFQYLSVLGCGAVPPNPAELLSSNSFSLILRELKKYFDVIIIDTPPATFQADVVSIASVAGSALLVAKGGSSKMANTKNLMGILSQAKAKVVGAILNQY